MEMLKEKPEVSDLSFLALLAANEIDQLRREEDTDCHYTSVLRDRLLRQIPTSSGEGVRGLAPSALRVYRAAIKAATKDPANNFETLSKLLNNIIEGLRRASAERPSTSQLTNSKENLDQVFVFLTTLHGQLLEQKQGTFGRHTSERYKV